MNHYPPKNTEELESGAYGDKQYEIDLIAEKSLVSSIGDQLPGYSIISEESGIIKAGPGNNIVLMDPIDGSLNAIRGIPFFSSTLALANGHTFSDITSAGVIDMIRGDIYLADANRSTLNGFPLRPSTIRELGSALISLDMKVRNPSDEGVFERVMNLVRDAKSSRVLGSAALETVYAATGKVDAFVAPLEQLRTFDCLPSIFIAGRAGAFVKTINLNLDTLDLYRRKGISYIVSSTEELGTSILTILDL